MKFRIYPKKEAVIELFKARQIDAAKGGDWFRADTLGEEIDLLISHGPPEIAVEIEDDP